MRKILFFALCLVVISTNTHALSLVPFSNPEDGYTISFPNDWSTQAHYLGTSVFSTSPLGDAMDTVRENVNVVSERLSVPLSSEQYYQSNLISMRQILKDLSVTDATPVQMGRATAVRVIVSQQVGERKQKNLVYFVSFGGRGYVITCSAEPHTFDLFRPLFEQIVATFALTQGS